MDCNYPCFKSGGCRTIGDYNGFELGCSIVPRREIGAQQSSPDRYSYSGSNSHRSFVDQEDH